MSEYDRIAEQMEVLRRRFRGRCEERGRELLAACDRQNWERLRSLAHEITGSAGLFGYPRISEEASSLSDMCRSGADEEAFEAGRALSASLLAVAAEED